MCLAKTHTDTDGITACGCCGPVPVVQLPGHIIHHTFKEVQRSPRLATGFVFITLLLSLVPVFSSQMSGWAYFWNVYGQIKHQM